MFRTEDADSQRIFENQRRSVMDLELVRTLTPRMYLRILLRTLPAVILGSGSW